MSKTILVFNMNSPDDRDDLILAQKARNLHSALQDVYKVLRGHEKHGAPALTRESFREILIDNEITGLDV